MSVRCFVCVSLDEEIRGQLVKWQEHLRSGHGRDFRWVAPENMHVTLSFLGDVPESQLAPIVDTLESAASDQRIFDLEVASSGAFPHPERARVLWAGIGDGADRLTHLQGTVQDGLQSEHGFRGDRRRYHPHITIARARARGRGPDMSGLLADSQGVTWGRQRVASIELMRSELRRGGPVYSVLASVELADE